MNCLDGVVASPSSPGARKSKPAAKPRINSIFPKTVVAKPKPATGRTQSLPMGQVQLPDNHKWSNRLMQAQQSKRDEQPAAGSFEREDPPQQFLIHSIFGVQAPIISGTGAQYTQDGQKGDDDADMQVGARQSQFSFSHPGQSIHHLAPGGGPLTSTNQRQRMQIDYANQVLTIRSPLEYMLQVTPDGKNIAVRNAQGSGLKVTDTVTTEKKSYDIALQQQQQLQEQNIVSSGGNGNDGKAPDSKEEAAEKLQRGNSSAFSKDFPTLNDAILKPVIHYSAVIGGDISLNDQAQKALIHINTCEEPEGIYPMREIHTKMKSINLDENEKPEIATTLLMRTEQSAYGTTFNHRPTESQNDFSAISPTSVKKRPIIDPAAFKTNTSFVLQTTSPQVIRPVVNSGQEPIGATTVKNRVIKGLHQTHHTLNLNSMMGGSRLPRRHTTLLNVTEPSNIIMTATTDQSCEGANGLNMQAASPDDMAANGGRGPHQPGSPGIQKSKSLMPQSQTAKQAAQAPQDNDAAALARKLTNKESSASTSGNAAKPQAQTATARQPNVFQVTFPGDASHRSKSNGGVSSATNKKLSKGCQIGSARNMTMMDAGGSGKQLSQQALHQNQSNAQIQTNYGNMPAPAVTHFTQNVIVTPIDSMLQEQRKPILQEDLDQMHKNQRLLSGGQTRQKNLQQRQSKATQARKLSMHSSNGQILLQQNSHKAGVQAAAEVITTQFDSNTQPIPEKLISTAKATNSKSSSRIRKGSFTASPRSNSSNQQLLIKPQQAQMILIEQRAKRPESKRHLPTTSEEFRVTTTESDQRVDTSPAMAQGAKTKNNTAGQMGGIMNAFYLKGTKASISSSTSNKFQQLKQRQIKFDAPKQLKNHNMVTSLAYRQQQQQQNAQTKAQQQKSLSQHQKHQAAQANNKKQQNLRKNIPQAMMVEQANQTSRNENMSPDNLLTKGTSITSQSIQFDGKKGVQMHLLSRSPRLHQQNGVQNTQQRNGLLEHAATFGPAKDAAERTEQLLLGAQQQKSNQNYNLTGNTADAGSELFKQRSMALEEIVGSVVGTEECTPTNGTNEPLMWQAMLTNNLDIPSTIEMQQEMASVLPAGMIDQESKIVVVKSQTGSSEGRDSSIEGQERSHLRKTGKVAVNELQMALETTANKINATQRAKTGDRKNKSFDNKGFQDRRQIKRNAYVSDCQNVVSPRNYWIQKKGSESPENSRANFQKLQANQQNKLANNLKSRQSMGVSYQPFSTQQDKRPTKSGTAAGRARQVNKEMPSSASLLTKPTNNTLSQVLGIVPQHLQLNSFSPRTMSPTEELESEHQDGQNMYIQNQRFTSELSQNHARGMTISAAQAKEFNQMRSRIKSQSGPRRRYINQRQNLYNLMASGLKVPNVSGGVGSVGPESKLISLTQNFDSENTTSRQFEQSSVPPMAAHSTQASQNADYHQQLQMPQMIDQSQSQQVQGQQLQNAYYRNSTKANFIAYEDQFGSHDAPDQQQHQLQHHYSPRTILFLQQQQQQTQPQPLSHYQTQQRMDLPHLMSEQQAHFMMQKTMKAEYLKQADKYQRSLERRGRAGRLCSSTHRHNPIANAQASQDFACPDEWIKERVQTSEGAIVEPKFLIVQDKKTQADFAKSSQSMTLQVPIQNANFIMQLSEDPNLPYSRSRHRKINEQALQENDETFALIDQHIARLVTRDKPSPFKDLIKKAGGLSGTKNDTHFKVGELVSQNKPSQTSSKEALLPNQSSSKQMSNSHEYHITTVPDNTTPKRKKIQILKVDASQGTSGQYFDTGGSFDQLENMRMSTKLLASDQYGGKNREILTLVKNADLPDGSAQNQDKQVQLVAAVSMQHVIAQNGQTQIAMGVGDMVAQTSALIKSKPSNTQLEMESGDFHVKVKRQNMSPQPIDTHSMLMNREEGQVQSDFIRVRQDYSIPAQIHGPAPVHGSMAILTKNPGQIIKGSPRGSRSPNVSGKPQVEDQTMEGSGQLVITNLNIQPRTQIRLKNSSHRMSQPTVSQSQAQQSKKSGGGIGTKMSTPGLNESPEQMMMIPSPTIFKEAATSSFQPKKGMRKHMDQLAVNEQKLNQKSEREKSFKVSGIKMFNPEMTPRSGAAHSHRNISEKKMVGRIRQSVEKSKELSVKQQQAAAAAASANPAAPATGLNEGERLVTIAHDNSKYNAHEERIDSYDGCSTENKSPSQLRSANQSPSQAFRIPSQRSDPKVLNMLLERAHSHKMTDQLNLKEMKSSDQKRSMTLTPTAIDCDGEENARKTEPDEQIN